MDRHNDETMCLVRSELADVAALPIKQAIRRMVAVAVAAHRIDPRLHRVLTEQIPRTGRLEHMDVFNRENFALFRRYLETCGDKVRVADLDLAAFVCVTSIEALAHNAVLRGDGRLLDGEGTLVDEATRLIAGYLHVR